MIESGRLPEYFLPIKFEYPHGLLRIEVCMTSVGYKEFDSTAEILMSSLGRYNPTEGPIIPSQTVR